MELGLYTFADIDPASTNKGAAGAQRMRELIAEIELADQVGLDVFGLASITARLHRLVAGDDPRGSGGEDQEHQAHQRRFGVEFG